MSRLLLVVGASHRVLTWAPHFAQGHRLKMLWQKIMHCTLCCLHSSKVELYANFFPGSKLHRQDWLQPAKLKEDKKSH